jgi:hypothetical protein
VSLKLPYKKFPIKGEGFYYSAILPVNIALPEKNAPRSKRFEAIIDSGASLCQFQAGIGKALGLDIEKGELREVMGISGPSRMYIHEISLYIPGGPIKAKAGFSDELPVLGLLGMNGFFEHFNITFDPIGLRCLLERLYQA